MPTRRAWLLGAGAVAAAAAGRVLGVRELFVVAALVPVLVLAAVAYVRLHPVDVVVRRRLVPARMPAGAPARAEVTVANRGRRRTPILELADGPGPSRHLVVLEPGEEATGGYDLPPTRRGLHPVGPLTVVLADPFGLASRPVAVLGPSTLTVHPVVEDVPPPPPPPPGTAPAAARLPALLSSRGEDFHALRPYVEGDDLRMVHWPSSARRDELLVRQEEAPRPRETTVLLDLRRSVHDPVSLEAAVSAAASVVAAGLGDAGTVRLVTSGGADSGTAGGEAHLDAILDLLAAVESDPSEGLDGAVPGLAEAGGGTLVLVTTTAVATGGPASLASLHRLSPVVVGVLLERPGLPPPAGVPFDRTVTVGRREGFAVAWRRALGGLEAGG